MTGPGINGPEENTHHFGIPDPKRQLPSQNLVHTMQQSAD